MAVVVRPRLFWHKGYVLSCFSPPQYLNKLNIRQFSCSQSLYSIVSVCNCSHYYYLCTVECFFMLQTNFTHLLCPPVSQHQRCPRLRAGMSGLDGCSSGNVPFQSAFAPSISSLIPLRTIPAKTGIWWEGNVAEWGRKGDKSEIQLVY